MIKLFITVKDMGKKGVIVEADAKGNRGDNPKEDKVADIITQYFGRALNRINKNKSLCRD